MIRLTKIALITTWALAFSANAEVQESASSPASVAPPATITKIEGESDKALSIVTVGLSVKPEWPSLIVEDHGTFVQVLMPSTVVPEPGTFIDAHSPFITKIAAFQVNNQASGQPSDAAIRMFVNRDAAAVKEATVAEILADRLVVTLDHKKLEGALNRSGALVSPASAAIPAIEMEREPSPAELVRATEKEDRSPASWPAAGIKVPDLSKKLAIASGFSLFMLALMGLVYRYKRINPFRNGSFRPDLQRPVRQMKKMIKHRVPESEDGDDYAREISMKTISTMALGARQKLALVQVGPETLLLSVTPTGVQFLTNIGAQSRQGLNQLPVSQSAGSIESISHPALSAGRGFEERLASDTLDEISQAVKPAKLPTKTGLKVNARQGASGTKKVRVAVTDDGLTDISGESPTRENRAELKGAEPKNDAKPTDDITRLIREKLRNLPVI